MRGEKYLLGLVPIVFLVLIADVTESYRDLLVFGLSVVLIFYFLATHHFYFRSYPVLPDPIKKTLIIFFLAMIVSTLSSNYFFRGVEQIIRASAFVVIYYILTSLINSLDKLKLIINALIISGSILSISILNEFIQRGFTIILEGNALFRLGGFFSNANFVSVIIFIAVMLSLASFISANKGLKKNVYLLSCAFNCLVLLLNNSRSSLLALFVAVVTLLLFMNRKVMWRALFLLLTFTLILLLFTDAFRFLEFYLRLEHLGSGRENYWSMALNTFADNPIFGVGPSSFKYVMYKYLPVQLGSWDEQIMARLISITDFGYQHNFFLLIASEMGVVGVFAGSFLIFNFIKYGLESIEKLKSVNSSELIFCIVCFSIGIGIFFRALFESINIFSYGWLSADLPFWLIFFILIKLPSLISSQASKFETKSTVL